MGREEETVRWRRCGDGRGSVVLVGRFHGNHHEILHMATGIVALYLDLVQSLLVVVFL